MTGVEGHLFDEPQMQVLLKAPLQQVGGLGIVDPGQQHCVDLHGGEAGGLRAVDAFEHSSEEWAPGHGFEDLRIDRVERDVDAIQSRFLQPRGTFVQTDRVRRQCDVRSRLQRRDPGDDVVDVLAGQGFAAGEPHLVDAELLHRDAHEADDFVAGHRGVARHELDAFFRHAVRAAQVAEVRERDAEVASAPIEGVEQSVFAVRGEFLARVDRRSSQHRHG